MTDSTVHNIVELLHLELVPKVGHGVLIFVQDANDCLLIAGLQSTNGFFDRV